MDVSTSPLKSYRRVREFTESICSTLEREDFVVQTMPDVSPTKWHVAHTTWFFETFMLRPHLDGYQPLESKYEYLFNSYYNAVGAQYPRPHRGLLSRPTVPEVFAYRAYVDEHMSTLLEARGDELSPLLELGLNHEQQHQELMLTDIKHVFATNPLKPALRELAVSDATAPELSWTTFEPGLIEVGFDGEGFSFDNEHPRHRVFLEPFELADRAVTNGEFLQFVEDGGYDTTSLWLSDGWSAVREQGLEAPLYWERTDDGWQNMTLGGFRPLNLAEPVVHVSQWEADAFAQWAGARLPTEFEWEFAAHRAGPAGTFADGGHWHPRQAEAGECSQMFGDVWEWTRSAYLPYPGYSPAEGALGEYNGKFMSGQMVLRGGSCATSETQVRATYRNFFPPSARWQFSGIRLAKDAR